MSPTVKHARQASLPWYRQFWPWFLMALPATAVVASLTSAWFAVTTSDGLVTDDYYQEGRAIAETLARSQRAKTLDIMAGVSLSRESMKIRLSGNDQFVLPPALNAMLSHPTRAGLDRQLALKREGDSYVGEMLLPASGHWLVLVEDEAKTWRLLGSMRLPAANETIIGGAEGLKPRS